MKRLYIAIYLFISFALTIYAQTKLPATVTKSGTSVSVIKVVSGGTDDVIVIDNTGGGTDNTGDDIPDTHAYVDLGLSVKWATCNIGAENPEDYGDYFAWGETTGYNEGKTSFSMYTYTLCEGSDYTMTKYCRCTTFGKIDNILVLEATDDAARVNWGTKWRMPTIEELKELRTNCTWTWTTQNNVKGYKVTSKSNGNSIFLPAAGWRKQGSSENKGTQGHYWSSSLSSGSSSYCAQYEYLSSITAESRCNERYYGRSIRPVRP